jgi:cobalt/nickel transport protein
MWLGVAAALLLAIFISPFASQSPDGLERVAEDKGFLEKGEGQPVMNAPVPDYIMPGVKNESVATSLAGVLGVVVVFAVGYGAGSLLKKRG